MATRAPIELDEWYHCYNRGVDKRRVFEAPRDYERFLLLLYLCNASERLHVSDLYNRSLEKVFGNQSLAKERGESIVEIGAYSLMPNHFHMALKEIKEGGISLFMQKVMTGYTMYFNTKNDRTGALFAGTFKAKHVDDDRYFKKLLSYIHMNAAELVEPEWRRGVGRISGVKKFLMSYRYASLPDFMSRFNLDMSHGGILSIRVRDYFDARPPVAEMLREAKEYYKDMHGKV